MDDQDDDFPEQGMVTIIQNDQSAMMNAVKRGLAGEAASLLFKPQADRLERWAMFLRAFSYEIFHINGEDNVWADMLSRWGATD